ncbi:unnamed protein product, partial [marine sediment metagenome]
VVLNDVPPGETVAGAPAVPIKFLGNYVHPSFVYGENLKIGKFNNIHEGVVVGKDVNICSFVELKKDTVFGDRVYVDSGVKSSGECRIGNDVTLGYDVTLAAGIEICSGTIIGSKSNVKKSILEPGIYAGNPARMLENR